MFIELLKKMSIDYSDRGLQFEELKEKYLTYFKKNMKNSNLYCDVLSMNLLNTDFNNAPSHVAVPVSSARAVTTQPIPQTENETESHTDGVCETKCYARTATGTQCSRKKQKNSDFCGSHTHKQPYGRIDQQINGDNQPKRRGRPPSNKKIETVDDNTKADATVEKIDGIEYIVDKSNGNIYKTNDDIDAENTDEVSMDDLKLIGKKMEDGTITWYTPTDLLYMAH
jgi:hypothetical protein